MAGLAAAHARVRKLVFAFLVLIALPLPALADYQVVDWRYESRTKAEAYTDCVYRLSLHDLVGHTHYVNHGCTLGTDPSNGREAYVGFAEWDSSYYGPVDMHGYSYWRADGGVCPAGTNWSEALHDCDPNVDAQGNYHVQMWGTNDDSHDVAYSECLRKMVEIAPVNNTNYVPGTCHDDVGATGAPAVVVTAEWDSYYYGHVIGHGYDYYPEPSDPADEDSGMTCPDQKAAPLLSQFCGNPINTANGNKIQIETDYEGSGLLSFVRYYNSSSSIPKTFFGHRWTNTYLRRVIKDPNDANRVVLRRPDGHAIEFFSGSTYWTSAAHPEAKLQRLVDGSGLLTGWTYTATDGREVENYDDRGRLMSIVRMDGTSINLVYNYGFIEASTKDYLLTSVIGQDGRRLDFGYDGANQLISMVDSAGAQTTYGYDGLGRLTSVTYPGGASKSYLYGESDHMEINNFPAALTGIIDEKGQRFASFDYANSGKAKATEHAGGVERNVVALTSETSSTVTFPSGLVQDRQFVRVNGVLRPSSISMTANGATRTYGYTYDANGHLDVSTDALSTRTNYDYDSRGRLTQQVDSENVAASKRTIQTDWHATFDVPVERRVLNSAGVLEAKSTWTYNSRGQVLTATRVNLSNASLSQTSTFTYCESSGVSAGTCPIVGLLLSIDGPRTDVTDVTSFSYRQNDEASCAAAPTSCPYRKGDLWKVTNAKGQVTEIQRLDAAGRTLSTKDANGVVTDLEYNARGWITASKLRGSDNSSEADDAIARLEYDPTGAVTKVTQPDGVYVTFTYDAAHRLTDVGDAQGNTIHYSLDNASRRFHEETKNNAAVVKHQLSRVFDTLGQIQTLADAQSTPTDFTYDLNGGLDKVTDPLLRVTDRDLDALGRLTKVIANTGGSANDKATSQFVYDARDNLRTVIDPKGLSTNYTFDSTDNLTQLSSPDTGSAIYTYDSAGNRVGEMRADNVSQGFVYDQLGRLTNQTFAQSGQNIAFTYDTAQSDCAAGETYSVGHLTKFTDSTGSTRLCYDIRGNLVRKVQSVTMGGVTTNFTVGATYNAGGRVTAMTYPSGAVVAYYRDANGRIVGVDAKPTASAAQVPMVSTVSYLPFGPINSLTFGNGRALTKAYDQNYGIDSVSDSAASNPLSEDFTLNSAGNVTGLTERTSASATATRTFTYDGLDRLTAQKNGATTVEGFSYDATGNRLSKTAGTTTAYSYPAGSHRLSSVGSTGRTYNATGETLTVGTGGSSKKFTYDLRHRLATYSQNNTLKLTNLYNAIGQRVAKQSVPASGSTQFVYDEAGHLLGEYTTTGARIKEYVWLDDTLVAVLGTFDGKDYHFVETDHLGAPRAVVHPTKNTIEWRWDANPTAFGEHAPNGNPDGDSLSFALNLRFPGQYFDQESGLYYNYFRNYDPATGRYVESDPIGLAGGASTYAYAGASPQNAFDSMGLMAYVCRKDNVVLIRIPVTFLHASDVSEQDLQRIARTVAGGYTGRFGDYSVVTHIQRTTTSDETQTNVVWVLNGRGDSNDSGRIYDDEHFTTLWHEGGHWAGQDDRPTAFQMANIMFSPMNGLPPGVQYTHREAEARRVDSTNIDAILRSSENRRDPQICGCD